MKHHLSRASCRSLRGGPTPVRGQLVSGSASTTQLPRLRGRRVCYEGNQFNSYRSSFIALPSSKDPVDHCGRLSCGPGSYKREHFYFNIYLLFLLCFIYIIYYLIFIYYFYYFLFIFFIFLFLDIKTFFFQNDTPYWIFTEWSMAIRKMKLSCSSKLSSR